LDEDKKGNDSIPYSSKEKVAKIPGEAIKGLTTALCLTGTAEEIDAGLVERLTSFTESHVQLQEVFDQAGKQIAEAVRAIKEREERDRRENRRPSRRTRQSKRVSRRTPDRKTTTHRRIASRPRRSHCLKISVCFDASDQQERKRVRHV